MGDDEDALSSGAVLRAYFRGNTGGRVANPKCDAPNCNSTTREGKPYCSAHVELSPYVQTLARELALRDAEADALIAGKPIPLDGHLVRETLLMLQQGSYTAAKLSRLMDISHEATDGLIRFLHANELAIMSKTDRGAIVIRKQDLSQRGNN